MKRTENKEVAVSVSLTTMAGNIFLTLFKLFAGLFSHSSAMISDAVHSASDVFSTIIVFQSSINIRLVEYCLEVSSTQ